MKYWGTESPRPPDLGMTLPYNVEVYQLAFFGTIFVISLGLCIWLSIKHKTILPLTLLAGSQIVGFYFEPQIEQLGLMHYARATYQVPWAIAGGQIPLFAPLAYGPYLGPGFYLIARYFQEPGRTYWDVFKIAGATFLTEGTMEMILIHLGDWTYYADQPLRFFDLPLWWIIVNATYLTVVPFLVVCLAPFIQGWRALLMVILLPSLVCMSHLLLAWPIWGAIKTPSIPELLIPSVIITAIVSWFFLDAVARTLAAGKVQRDVLV